MPIHSGKSFGVGLALACCLAAGGCRKEAPAQPLADGADVGGLSMPKRALERHTDGSITFSGHWKRVEAEVPPGQEPLAARMVNATSVRCWPSKMVCEESRAQVSHGVLSTEEPMHYEVTKWDATQTVAERQHGLDIRLLLRIDTATGQVEMECRREFRIGRGNVFEKWVLE